MFWVDRALAVLDNLDRHGLGCALVIGADALNINDLGFLVADLVVAEDEGYILGHALLADDDALAALNDEIAADILGTLAELTGRLLGRIKEQTVVAADHDGNPADLDMRKSASAHRDFRLFTGDGGRGLHRVRRNDVGVDGRGVRHITETGVIGIHGRDGTVVLKDGRLADLDVGEFHADLHVAGRRSTGLGGGGLEKRTTGFRGSIRGRIFGTLYAYTDGRTGSTGSSTGRPRQIQIRRTSDAYWTGSQDCLWYLHIHKMVEGGDLMVDNLSVIVLREIQL